MKGDRHTMKSLILTTQDARELDKLGGLTITKPINHIIFCAVNFVDYHKYNSNKRSYYGCLLYTF